MGAKAKKRARLSAIDQKLKELAMMNEYCAKIDIIETKVVSLSSLARVMKKRGN
jgi:hypothetical protein